jgi:hypothetical protein
MPKTHVIPLFQTWVKNVYSLCREGVVTSAQSYTGSLVTTPKATWVRVQPTGYTHTMDSFTPALYTVKFSLFNLLNTYLYTLSTAPTIKKRKENMKGIS